ncbi:predicted protein [Sclerotinia sclerotiorum 1980 UF-70]|uniref:Uncharacterized protein n=1 Tax=Sclerotinia sclerotiorum (strain ATCC 18683 / 1980 / Ss-1) TaxID=665079 RepID=A7EIN7_SCLS1|nr:predicted protein [Sclerotinia sclerotiorum 1980 UF-70]EDO02703.1 predicted protein [Sclerotinia sclerotiorum 1980 UF-70]
MGIDELHKDEHLPAEAQISNELPSQLEDITLVVEQNDVVARIAKPRVIDPAHTRMPADSYERYAVCDRS